MGSTSAGMTIVLLRPPSPLTRTPYLGTQDVEYCYSTGGPGGVRKRSGAITTSTLFTATMPPISSIYSILEGGLA